MIDAPPSPDPWTSATGGSVGNPSRSSGASESGFSLVELFMSATILLVISIAVFGALDRIQRTAGYQAEVQAILDNTRNALQAMERCIRQAGNDPHGSGFEAISIVGPAELRVRSDITGSIRSGNGDKGDPDGDINDSGENFLIRYNNGQRRLEMASRGGPAQIIAENISGLSMEYFDSNGRPTVVGKEVRKITITIIGSSLYKDPWTGRPYGVQLESTIRMLT